MNLQDVIQTLKHAVKKKELIELTINKFEKGDVRKHKEKLNEAIKNYPELQILNITKIQGEKLISDLQELLEIFSQCPALTILRLNNNQINPEGIGTLSAILPKYRSLKVLELSNNEISNEGMQAIAAILPQCPAFTSIDVSDNNIGSEGAQAFATVLPHCPILSKIIIANNNIHNGGLEAFAAVLPKCTALTHLDMQNNNINGNSIDNVSSLVNNLPKCFLANLNLSHNPLGDLAYSEIDSLPNIIPNCFSLTTVSLDDIKCGSHQKDSIKKLINEITPLLNQNDNTKKGLFTACKSGNMELVKLYCKNSKILWIRDNEGL